MIPFIDSNILVYAMQPGDEPRQAVARQLLSRFPAGDITVSPQVLAETYNVLCLKFRVARHEALVAVRGLHGLRVWVPGAETVMRALELSADHGLPTWDAMIIRAAMEAGCNTLFSEDLQAGRRFGALEIVNPFDAAAHEPAVPLAPVRGKRARQTPARR